MNDFLQDVTFAWRNALKKPATVLLIVITLALGIGVNTAMFSMAWRVLLAPLPYADAERLVKLEQNETENGQLDLEWSVPTFDDYARLEDVFSALLQYQNFPYTVLGADEPYLAQTGIVSWNYFAVLGIQPLLGSSFIAAHDAIDAEPVMLLSYNFWMTHLGADPDIIGTNLEVQGVSRRVIGVLPDIAPYPHANDIWITAGNDPFRVYMGVDMSADRDNTFPTHVFGKLREDISLADAEREVDLLARRLVTAYPDFYAEDYTVALKTLREEMVADSRISVVLLAGLAVLVLLIASANVASLNLARIADRNQELAIRESVGASPSRITRQLLTENMLLALIGGLAGLVVAWPCLRLLSDFASGYTPLARDVGMDASLLLFAFAIAMLTGILSGAISAFGERDINSALKEGGDKVTSSSGSVQRRQALLFMQFALAFVALTVSALVVLSLYRLNNQDLGYDPDRILSLSMQFDIKPDDPLEDVQRRSRVFIARILQETSAIPGVEAVGILDRSPLLQSSRISERLTPFDVEGLPTDPD
ncbi:MAG: FtsX-like permease family protein, partial [Pseudomonadota bacterium]